MDPHSTDRKGRTCVSCHTDPRATGLGTGTLTYNKGHWDFSAAMWSSPGITGLDHPLDAFVDINGRPLVNTSRPGLRTFNRKEIENILYVGLCLECHQDFRDSVMKNWKHGTRPVPSSRCNLQESMLTARYRQQHENSE